MKAVLSSEVLIKSLCTLFFFSVLLSTTEWSYYFEMFSAAKILLSSIVQLLIKSSAGIALTFSWLWKMAMVYRSNSNFILFNFRHLISSLSCVNSVVYGFILPDTLSRQLVKTCLLSGSKVTLFLNFSVFIDLKIMIYYYNLKSKL